jgi:8-oxo-dGTP diphosphatase
VIRAAGGIVVRAGAEGPEVLVVHRPKYDDWSFPKGKALVRERDEDCARREVEEETGLVCELEADLGVSRYTDAKGRPKRVRYWLMRPTAGELAFRNEVDDAAWSSFDDARELLTYPRDRAVLTGIEPAALATAL